MRYVIRGGYALLITHSETIYPQFRHGQKKLALARPLALHRKNMKQFSRPHKNIFKSSTFVSIGIWE